MYTRQLLTAPMDTVCITSANDSVDGTESHLWKRPNLWDKFMTTDLLHVQFKLNSYTDLHHLFSAQYLLDSILLPENLFHSKIQILNRIVAYSKLLELQNIDWTLPDVAIVEKLAGLAAYLQNEHTELLQYWSSLWRQFIKSDAPTGRLETNLMQQLREKAFDEYVKVKVFLDLCILTVMVCVCEDVKFISQTHPSVQIRRGIFQELIHIINILQSSEPRGILTQLLTRQFLNVLEEVKPTVFSKEVLERAI
ncbi:uncharacterized protein VTP21DRAFT_8148 [Calcarisporiella thermophila]|uniref:uncharacterized protein n=1 Tax=Calcarisporiella thermophila TaxID=911321 RepID=UPI003743A94C